ncbi:hypothetical protein JOS77_27060 [Chromobacterium haemolyticum]|nr:hypothetical protein JOS77_27060 [Chromobacterium haemolyticum]
MVTSTLLPFNAITFISAIAHCDTPAFLPEQGLLPHFARAGAASRARDRSAKASFFMLWSSRNGNGIFRKSEVTSNDICYNNTS